MCCLRVVWRLIFVVDGMPFAVRCSSIVVCCLLLVVRCVLGVFICVCACCVLFGGVLSVWLLFGGCLLFAVWRLVARCSLCGV